MSKHKKTRKEKIIADYRHNAYVLENKNFSTPNSSIAKIIINANSYSYSYVMQDVLKTTILTFIIIAGEIILFFLLKNKIITIPIISY